MSEWEELSDDVGAGMARLNLDTLKRYLDESKAELEYQEIELLTGEKQLVLVRVFFRKSNPDQPIAAFPVRHPDEAEAHPHAVYAPRSAFEG